MGEDTVAKQDILYRAWIGCCFCLFKNILLLLKKPPMAFPPSHFHLEARHANHIEELEVIDEAFAKIYQQEEQKLDKPVIETGTSSMLKMRYTTKPLAR
jgi:hypothetical protein